ncbi:hypothetical protein JMN32_02425 [Fulvivirga sp. 29W222]|uniref:Uncharacterized protein n=1 Tax=Fulvivirga marina TaxID=2494733 RepID=A0A937FVQ1_9BACT|nr:hypothetical protein [Fulvivirga marina]MBL6445146.1 hypothetical protein [Fulvivirga marina]
MKPKIYALLSASTPGQMGGATEIITRKCKKCRRVLEESVKQLGYEFDFWSGEDFIYMTPYYIVSERLKNELELRNLKGMDFQKIIVDTEEYFDIDEDAYSQTLPNFYYLNIKGQAKEKPIWYEIKDSGCDMCHMEIAPYKSDILDLIGEITQYKEVERVGELAKRQVYFESWQGEDIFRVDEKRRKEKRLLLLKSF